MAAIKTPGSDLTIVPLALNVDFLGLWRGGPKLIYGQTQEIKAEFVGVELKLQKCQHVKDTRDNQ